MNILRLKDDSVTQLISDEGVNRTAPATPGLLIIVAVSLRAARTLLKILWSKS